MRMTSALCARRFGRERRGEVFFVVLGRQQFVAQRADMRFAVNFYVTEFASHRRPPPRN